MTQSEYAPRTRAEEGAAADTMSGVEMKRGEAGMEQASALNCDGVGYEGLAGTGGCNGASEGGCGGSSVNEGGSCGSDTGVQFGLSAARHRGWSMLIVGHARATARINRRVEAEGGLPLDWYDVLLVLEYAPEGRRRMGELSEHVMLSRSGLTRLIDRIEAAGLVERRLCPSDRRVFEVLLTPQGRAARAASWPLYARTIAEEFGDRYSDEEAAQLAELLARQLKDE